MTLGSDHAVVVNFPRLMSCLTLILYNSSMRYLDDLEIDENMFIDEPPYENLIVKMECHMASSERIEFHFRHTNGKSDNDDVST